MDIIYNAADKTIVCALPRCGTNYLRSFAKKSQKWKTDVCFPQGFPFEENTIVKVVRNPAERCRSWFYAFVFDDNIHPYWNIIDAVKFVDQFETSMHYDEHTGFQHILYNLNPIVNHNTIYVRMENIGLFLEDSNIPHYAGIKHGTRESSLHPCVKEYLCDRFEKIYQKDLNWIKSLDLWGEKLLTV